MTRRTCTFGLMMLLLLSLLGLVDFFEETAVEADFLQGHWATNFILSYVCGWHTFALSPGGIVSTLGRQLTHLDSLESLYFFQFPLLVGDFVRLFLFMSVVRLDDHLYVFLIVLQFVCFILSSLLHLSRKCLANIEVSLMRILLFLFLSFFRLPVSLCGILQETQVFGTLCFLVFLSNGLSHASHGVLDPRLPLCPLLGPLLLLLVH